MIIQKIEFNKGDSIEFRSDSEVDSNLWVGTIAALDCTTEIAQLCTDVIAYNQQVNITRVNARKSQLSVDDLNYFIMDCADGKKRAFAVEWLTEGSVRKTNTSMDLLIKIYGVVPADSDKIVTLLRNAGYTCKVI